MKQNNKWMLVAIALLALVALPLVGCKHEADSGVKAPKTTSVSFADSSGTTLTFTMVSVLGGTVEGDTPTWLGEKPSHNDKGVFVKGRTVILSAFEISKHEVTQAEWKAVMTGNKNGIQTNPSEFKGDNLPVENVSWYDAVYFCNELTEKTMSAGDCVYTIKDIKKTDDGASILSATVSQNLGKKGYRLPTEAEWEYAARGGDPSKDAWNYQYAGSDTIGDVAWYKGNSSSKTNEVGNSTSEKTHEVGNKTANNLGIHDMSGNVFEWCWDWWSTFPTAGDGEESPVTVTDPTGPETEPSRDPNRINRGGGWGHSDEHCPVSRRGVNSPGGRNEYIGFRVVRSLGTTEESQ